MVDTGDIHRAPLLKRIADLDAELEEARQKLNLLATTIVEAYEWSQVVVRIPSNPRLKEPRPLYSTVAKAISGKDGAALEVAREVVAAREAGD